MKYTANEIRMKLNVLAVKVFMHELVFLFCVILCGKIALTVNSYIH